MTATTPTTATATSTVTLPATELRRAILDVIPLARRDDWVPVLRSVHLDVNERTLTATATDQVALGSSTADVSAATGAPWQCTLHLRDARDLAKALADRAGEVTITTADGQIVVAGATSRCYTALPDSYPNYRGALTRPPEPTTAAYFDPALLARFAKVHRGPREPMRMEFAGDLGVVIVRIGSHFVGAIQPARRPKHVSGPSLGGQP